MRKFLQGRKLSLTGTVVVAIVAILAPYINAEITHRQTLTMLALFILFVIAVDFFYVRNK